MFRSSSAAANQAFEHLGPKNPLRQLAVKDRVSLWALLVLYSRASSSNIDKSVFSPHANVSELVRDAAELGRRLEQELFKCNSEEAEALKPLCAGFDVLPVILQSFAQVMKAGLDQLGKPGQMGKNLTNAYLIQASEFIRSKLGKYYDDHLSELLQAVATRDKDSEEDLSGDAIRKQRQYMSKNYGIMRGVYAGKGREMAGGSPAAVISSDQEPSF